MASTSAYSKRSSSVKRLLQEAKELASETGDGIHAAPFEDNLYHWHFTITGPKDSEFEGGLYHGRITVRLSISHAHPATSACSCGRQSYASTNICACIRSYRLSIRSKPPVGVVLYSSSRSSPVRLGLPPVWTLSSTGDALHLEYALTLRTFPQLDIMLLTPNGRFELNKKVCLTSKWRCYL